MTDLRLLLLGWQNFYASMSQAAAALIGLLFVVITLAAERRPDDLDKIRIYITPTVIYFASVLGVAELLIMPNHTRLSAALCAGLMGLAGLIYSGSLFMGKGGTKRQDFYDRVDMVLYAVVPLASYAVLMVGAALLRRHIEHGLACVAISMLVLLTLGIRNSWAVVVDLVSTHRGK